KLKSKERVKHLDIFVSHQEESGEWGPAKEVAFNSVDYSNGHPVVSEDGKQLYFVSDMPGGFGNTDIYVVDIEEDGTYSDPKNLGPLVNSDRKEMFPSVTKEHLYFASDRKSSLGGLDVYQSKLSESGEFERPMNMGEPFNSVKDDFSIMFKDDEVGYFASNRLGGKGDDDIYYFEIERSTELNENQNAISGQVFDAITKEPLANATVQLFDIKNMVIVEVDTDDEGRFKLENLISNHNYMMNVSRDNYQEVQMPIITKENMPIDLTQDLMPADAVVGNEGAKFKTEAVYFDFDKHQIRDDAKEELDRLAAYLVENSNLKIKIESHTDSRGRASYNKYLSERRAQASKDYLLAQGVAEDQIVSAIGYGEEMLLNDCVDNSVCSRAAHQLNRRSEFIFVTEEQEL
ncbi:MAG: OmpA family protein, partial [Bacteroidota bacterium]